MENSLLFKKFVSDNLMHEFHDDILPIYDRLRVSLYIHLISELWLFFIYFIDQFIIN